MDFKNLTDWQLADVIMDGNQNFDVKLAACDELEGRRMAWLETAITEQQCRKS